MSDPRPNPPRRSVFAAWHWPRWVLWLIVPLLPVFYFLSAAPIMYLMVAFGSHLPQRVILAMHWLLSPAIWSANNVEILGAVHAWEWAVLFQVFGQL
jgi:hypothetical protein